MSVPTAPGLRGRDPVFVRRTLPLLWPALQAWFRPEVRGLEHIPDSGPVLLVGNHSGGNVSPDTFVLAAAFNRRFGADRAFYQLAHDLVMAAPWLRLLRRYGTVAARPGTARAALRAGAAVLVYPGGDWEVHRPLGERNRIEFHGRHGFARLALQTGAPIVPVVAIGGQETALFLSRGDGLARALHLHRWLRVDVLPISLAVPWGLDVGDLFGHIPLPAKLVIEVLQPIEPTGTPDELYDTVTTRMQVTLDRLAGERRHLLLG